VVRQHHERHDGTGYPSGIAGDAVCIEARVVSVCDAWSAMRVDRSYRPARDEAEALAELRGAAGSQFDPLVVDAFLRIIDAASGPGRQEAHAVRAHDTRGSSAGPRSR
jgi:HD-GYP domain-containing protein (c-di-GMP phosphodiesterase class II)